MTAEANRALMESWHLSLHNKSPRTVVLYLDEVTRFARWLIEAGRPVDNVGDLVSVTRQDVEAWIHHLRALGRAQATIRARWIALRSFYGWCVDEGEVGADPLARVVVAKANPPPPNVLSDTEIRALLKVCEGGDFAARRDAALIRFFLSTGLRISEIVDLKVDDVDLRNRLVAVHHGKGDRARVVRFDPATATALDRYKRSRARHRHASMSWLWIGYQGRLTRKGIPSILNKRATEAGIGHIHPHQFRHSWADRWLRAGGSEGDLQRLGGWESAEIMRRYGSARAVDRALAAYDQVDLMGDL